MTPEILKTSVKVDGSLIVTIRIPPPEDKQWPRERKASKPYEHADGWQSKWMKLPDEIADEYTAGKTLAELGFKYNIATVSVSKKLRTLGVIVRKRGGNGRVNVEEALAMYDRGEKLQTIGDKFGVTREAIRLVALKHGREPRAEDRYRIARKREDENLELKKRRYFEKRKQLQELREKASKMWKAGKTVEEIEAKIGFNRGQFCYARLQHPEMFPYKRPNHWTQQ